MDDAASPDAAIQSGLFEVLAEGLSGGFLVYDRSDRIVFASRSLAALLGIPEDAQAPGTRLRDFLGQIYDCGLRSLDDGAGIGLTGREDWIADNIAILWKERSELVQQCHVNRLLSIVQRRLPSGYGICVMRDISEQKRRDEQWRLDMERLHVTEEALDDLPFPMLICDRNSVVVAVNKAACQWIGLPAEAVLGLASAQIHAPEFEERLQAIRGELIVNGEPRQFPELFRRQSGSRLVVVNNYRIGKPGRYYVVTAFEDITGLVAAESGNGEASIRPQPRMSGGGFIADQLNVHDQVPADLAQMIGRSQDLAGRRALIACSEAGVAAFSNGLLRGLGLETSRLAGHGEFELFLNYADEAGLRLDLVVVDKDFEAECRELAARRGIAVLTLRPGITAVEFSGAALRLLQRQVQAETPVPQPRKPAGSIDILVAEDNEVNRIFFAQILDSLGYSYLMAGDGEEAVALWQAHSPRLILMDVTLPKLDGFKATARIRLSETLENSVPIIGVLALPFEGDRDECFACGMNDAILKPISPDLLEQIFAAYLDPVIQSSSS